MSKTVLLRILFKKSRLCTQKNGKMLKKITFFVKCFKKTAFSIGIINFLKVFRRSSLSQDFLTNIKKRARSPFFYVKLSASKMLKRALFQSRHHIIANIIHFANTFNAAVFHHILSLTLIITNQRSGLIVINRKTFTNSLFGIVWTLY